MADRSGDGGEPSEFRIEVATEADLRAVAEVHSKAVLAAYRDVLPPGVFDPEHVAPEKVEKEFRETFEGFGPRDTLLKAVAGSTVVGTCICGDDSELGKADTGYLQRVYVDPAWWNRGVGTALVDRAVELLKGHGFRKLALQVLENNRKARAFYEKRGWRFEQKVRMKVVGMEVRYTKSVD